MVREALKRLGPLWGIVALVVGMALGSLFPGQLTPIGEGVLTALKFIAKAAPYIIFFTLVPALMGMYATGSAGRFAAYVAVGFMFTTLAAGILAVLLLIPMFQLRFVAQGGNVADALSAVGARTAELAVTSEPFIAIWYSILVSLLLYFGAKSRALAWFCRPTGNVIRSVGVDGVERLGHGLKVAFPFILLTIGVALPTIVGRAIASTEQSVTDAGGLAGLGGSSPILWYFITLAVLVGILMAFVFLFAYGVCRYTGFGFRRYFHEYFMYVYPFAWATASSAATIPINLDRAKEGLGARAEVRDFIIPLGATVNLDGTMIGAYVVTVVAGILVGYTPTALDLAILILPLTVVSVGIPGIPGGMAAVAPPVIVSVLPIPPEAQAAFIAIFIAFGVGPTDMFRTGVNSVDNGTLALLFEHWYPKKFQKGRAIPVDAPPEGAPAPVEASASGERD